MARSEGAAGGWGANRGSGPRTKKPLRGADAATEGSVHVASLFPPAQRLFVLFLEAADSHRFNSHLAMYALLALLPQDELETRKQ